MTYFSLTPLLAVIIQLGNIYNSARGGQKGYHAFTHFPPLSMPLINFFSKQPNCLVDGNIQQLIHVVVILSGQNFTFTNLPVGLSACQRNEERTETGSQTYERRKRGKQINYKFLNNKKSQFPLCVVS